MKTAGYHLGDQYSITKIRPWSLRFLSQISFAWLTLSCNKLWLVGLPFETECNLAADSFLFTRLHQLINLTHMTAYRTVFFIRIWSVGTQFLQVGYLSVSFCAYDWRLTSDNRLERNRLKFMLHIISCDFSVRKCRINVAWLIDWLLRNMWKEIYV